MRHDWLLAKQAITPGPSVGDSFRCWIAGCGCVLVRDYRSDSIKAQSLSEAPLGVDYGIGVAALFRGHRKSTVGIRRRGQRAERLSKQRRAAPHPSRFNQYGVKVQPR